MATNKWWLTSGTRSDAYLLATLVVIAFGLVVMLGFLAWIVILEAGIWLSMLLVGGPLALVVLIAETIHARSHRGR